MSKKMPRVYWDEKQQYYYITFFEDTECNEIVDAWKKFKGPKSKEQKKHDKHSN